MVDPLVHAEAVTGHKQLGVVDSWRECGLAVALSVVTGPHVYAFGAVPFQTVAVTLYGVERHVLMVDGRVRRDGPVLPGRFRIGAAGRDVLVDAVPRERQGRLLLAFIAPGLLQRLSEESGRAGPAELREESWDTEDPFLHMTARRLAEVLQRGRAVDRLFSDQVALTLALHLLDRYSVRGSPAPAVRTPGLPRPALRRVLEHIEARLDGRPSLEELAGVAGLSAHHFLRRFREATGTTPHRYVMQQRVAQAQALLAGTGLPVQEVALRCGFASASHLSHSFRAATCVSPLAYRRRGRGAGG